MMLVRRGHIDGYWRGDGNSNMGWEQDIKILHVGIRILFFTSMGYMHELWYMEGYHRVLGTRGGRSLDELSWSA